MSVTATANICNTRGLHARASAKFVKLASGFDAEIHVTRDGVTVNALSIMGLLMLGAGNGCEIAITGDGPDAAAAVAALTDLVGRRFDEDQ
ncbi:HPr family phosphocarrier protein [Brevundimonas sp. TWP2-3-4b2]|uniref:HPr family phosphocarrier protein n=1 Tax=Brevundimonas sp. TWP2-3-4b2 TaxID=2804595 RepID=UPI003CE69130